MRKALFTFFALFALLLLQASLVSAAYTRTISGLYITDDLSLSTVSGDSTNPDAPSTIEFKGSDPQRQTGTGATYASKIMCKPSNSGAKTITCGDYINDNAQEICSNIPSAILAECTINSESAGAGNAWSPKDARGLMQLIPATAKRFGVNDVWDPEQNIQGGMTYQRFLMNKFKCNIDKTIAGYNAGEGNVDKYGGIPPFRETQLYVPKVKSCVLAKMNSAGIGTA